MPFQKGHNLSQGRPKGAKNTLPKIRDKLFSILLTRIKDDKKLEGVDTATLIKFASACLPKDMSLSVNRDPNITYISNVPRPEVVNQNNEYLCIKDDSNNKGNMGDSTQVVDSAIDSTIL